MKTILRNTAAWVLSITLCITLFIGCTEKDSGVSPSVNSVESGKSGSTARFSFSGNTMFTLSGNFLVSYDASNPRNGLSRLDSLDVTFRSWGSAPETVFPFGNYVLLGTPSGMQIYSNSSGYLDYVSTYDHILSCDPVVAQGDYAYVTLSTGRTRCSRGLSQMEVVNIANVERPYGMGVVQLNNPGGLAVNNTDLFVCEENKLCQLDVRDPNSPFIIKRYDVVGSDCIYDGDRLIVVGAGGLTQYSIDGDNLNKISTIPAIRTK